jgi:hypothetical protein
MHHIGFKPSGNVDPVAEYVAVLDDDVAEIDPDAEYDPPILGRCSIAFGHRPLHRDCAGDGFDHARELHQHAIACGFDDATVMLGDPSHPAEETDLADKLKPAWQLEQEAHAISRLALPEHERRP